MDNTKTINIKDSISYEKVQNVPIISMIIIIMLVIMIVIIAHVLLPAGK